MPSANPVYYRMMKKTLLIIIPVFVLALFSAGCSDYAMLLKTGTPRQKYDAGKAYLNAGKHQRAADIFEEIRPMFMGMPQEDSILYFTGLAYYRMRNFETSGALFDEFRKTFGRSGLLEDAEYLYADGLFRSSPPPNRDQTQTVRAIMAIDEYLQRYPNSKHRETMLDQMDDLQDKLKEKAYINAKVYYNIGEYKAATVALRNALDQYPDTPHREEILYLIAKSNHLLATNSIEKLQRERFMNVQEAYYNFNGEYPESRYSKEVQKMYEDARKYLARFSQTQGEENETNTSTSNTEDGI